MTKQQKIDMRAEAFNSRGVTYGGKGEHEQAIDDFNQVIKLNEA